MEPLVSLGWEAVPQLGMLGWSVLVLFPWSVYLSRQEGSRRIFRLPLHIFRMLLLATYCSAIFLDFLVLVVCSRRRDTVSPNWAVVWMPVVIGSLMALSGIIYDIHEKHQRRRPLILLIPVWVLALVADTGTWVDLWTHRTVVQGVGTRMCLYGCRVGLGVLLLFVEVTVQVLPHVPTQKNVYMAVDGQDDADNSIPYDDESCNYLSAVIWWWFSVVLQRGYAQPLSAEDLGSVPAYDRTNRVTASYATIGTPTGRSLWPTVMHSTWPMMTLGGVCKLAGDLLGFAGPACLHGIVSYIEESQKQPENKSAWTGDIPITDFARNGYVLGLVLLVTALLQTILNHQFYHIVMRQGVHVRSALQATIYAKTLRLSAKARGEFTSGQLVNLLSNDTEKIMLLLWNGHYLWTSPISCAIALVLLGRLIGPSSLAGFGILVLFVPVQAKITSLWKTSQKSAIESSDRRLKYINEVLKGMKVVKLYGWEIPLLRNILNARGQELAARWKVCMVRAMLNFSVQALPVLVTLATFAVYCATTDGSLTPATAFTTVSLINMLRFPLFSLPMAIGNAIDASVSSKRINEFLSAEELSTPPKTDRYQGEDEGAAITITDGYFGWDQSQPPTLENINLQVGLGQLVMVVGAVGSGKSSLVAALLGEIKAVSPGTMVNVKGTVAFVGQEAWLVNATLRDNILFGRPYDEQRYQSTLQACELLADLQTLLRGDMSEIGEKGINLSGGQKQRVSLARALYSQADTFLIDDPLSALDAHVGQKVFHQCILSLRRQNRTVLLTLNQLQYLDQADLILVMENGHIAHAGTPNQLSHLSLSAIAGMPILSQSNETAPENELERPRANSNSSEADRKLLAAHQDGKSEIKDNDGKLIAEEEREVGAVSGRVYLTYLGAGGWFWVLTMLVLIVGSRVFMILTDWSLNSWSEDRDHLGPLHYLWVYACLSAASVVLTLFANVVAQYVGLRAAKVLHEGMLSHVLSAPMRFFDTTPLGRILNRFSSDTSTIDVKLGDTFQGMVLRAVILITTLAVQIKITPFFAVPAMALSGLYFAVQKYFRASSRELQRIESLARSPVFSQMSETMGGLATIRGYKVQDRFEATMMTRIDESTKAYLFLNTANRWIGVRLEFIGSFVTASAAWACLGAAGNIPPGLAGLSISYALSLTGTLNWLVRSIADTEMQMNSVERVGAYAALMPEKTVNLEANSVAEIAAKAHIPSNWPSTGKLELLDVSARYAPHLPPALRGITAHIPPGSHVGICGRTGGGKSSLILALFRMIDTKGSVLIDGVDTATIPLQVLRSRLAIIPQDPVLFSGTLRYNLDPVGLCSDTGIWDSLRLVHLYEYVSTELQGGLDSTISEGGDNLSVGQRQQVVLARALLRKPQILVMDEATSSVDPHTDALIQQSIRQVCSQSTVLTIAHRLNTIMDSDYIMVLGGGQLQEFDSPARLLARPTSQFAALVAAAAQAGEKLLP